MEYTHERAKLLVYVLAAIAEGLANCEADASSCCLLQGVKNSDALRAVVDQLQPEQVRISQRLSQSSPLYSKFEAIRKSTGNWSESETRYVCQAP